MTASAATRRTAIGISIFVLAVLAPEEGTPATTEELSSKAVHPGDQQVKGFSRETPAKSLVGGATEGHKAKNAKTRWWREDDFEKALTSSWNALNLTRTTNGRSGGEADVRCGRGGRDGRFVCRIRARVAVDGKRKDVDDTKERNYEYRRGDATARWLRDQIARQLPAAISSDSRGPQRRAKTTLVALRVSQQAPKPPTAAASSQVNNAAKKEEADPSFFSVEVDVAVEEEKDEGEREASAARKGARRLPRGGRRRRGGDASTNKGTIPPWLRGSLYRVGPGIIQVGDACYNHPFDMLSVVHRYTVGPSDGDNTYRNKVVDSKSREHAVAASVAATASSSRGGSGDSGDSSPGGGQFPGVEDLGQCGSPDPFKTRLQRFTALFQRSKAPPQGNVCDNCIDNLCFFGNDLYIMSDIAHMLKIQPETLDTLAKVDLEEFTPVKMTCSHPHVDEDGTVWNVGTSHDPKKGYFYSVIKYQKTNPDWSGTMILENGEVTCRIPARHKSSPAYFHSFGATRDFIVFIEQPLYVADEDCRNGAGGAAAGRQNLKWKKTEMVHLHLVDKRTGSLCPSVYTCEPFFFFHVVNAHQHGGDQQVVVDLIAYKDAEIMSDLKFSHIERTDHVQHARPIRITLPLHSTTPGKVVVRKEVLVAEATMEFPRINYAYAGRENRYFYALGHEYLHPNRIMKVDTMTGDVTSWKDPGHFVSEPVFIPKPADGDNNPVATNGNNCRNDGDAGGEEDRGLLMLTLLSAASLQSVDLVLLDASDLSEVARVSYHATGTVTQGLHGVFVWEDDDERGNTRWKY